MNDRPDEHSGSRWEPAPPPPGDGPSPAGEAEPNPAGSDPAGEDAAAPSTPADGDPVGHVFASGRPGAEDQGTDGRRFTWRGRGPLVALAAGIVALSGVGGYALGNAGSATDQVGLVGNQTPGDGGLPGGGMPGDEQGELQGVPPWDHDGDGDGHGWGDHDRDHDRDGDGSGPHGWAPGAPPGDGQVPSPPDGYSPGGTDDGTTHGRDT